MIQKIIKYCHLTGGWPKIWLASSVLAIFFSTLALATVTSQFTLAQKLYDSGQMGKAAKVLRATVKKYPNHQPSQLLLGRIFYRAGRINDAGRHFRLVAPDLVPPDVGYEYGVTMFTFNNCQKALNGLAKVPPSAAEFRLAQFYRGVCHMRARRWQRADYFFSKATGLPANLESSRRKLMSVVRQQLREERRGRESLNNPYVIVPPPPAYSEQANSAAPVPTSPAPEPSASPKKKASVPPPPVVGFSTAFRPSITMTQSQKTQDFFGTSTKQTDTQSNELKLSFKGRYDFHPRSFGGQPYITLGMDVGQVATNVKVSSAKYTQQASDPGTIREETSESAPVSSTVGKVVVVPEVGYPISGALDLTLAYAAKENYPDLSGGEKSGEYAPTGTVTLGIGAFIVKGSASLIDTATYNSVKQVTEKSKQTTVFGGEATVNFDAGVSIEASVEQRASQPVGDPSTSGCDPNTMRQCSVTNFGLGANKSWESVTLALVVTQLTYTPPANQPKPGEDASLKTELSATQNFDFGGSASLVGSLTELEQYKTNVASSTATTEGETVQVVASGSVQKIAASFKLAPVDWIYGQATYAITSQSFQISKGTEDPGAQSLFEQQTAQDIHEFALELGLSKTF